MLGRGRDESFVTQAQVVSVGIGKYHLSPGLHHGKRRGHERIRRTEDLLALQFKILHASHGCLGPTGRRNDRNALPPRPFFLEQGSELSFRPSLAGEDLIPTVMDSLLVAPLETDLE